METFPALLVLCAENSSVTGEFSSQRPVTWSFDVFFDLRLNKRLSKHPRRSWFETQSRSLWIHCNHNVWDVTCITVSNYCWRLSPTGLTGNYHPVTGRDSSGLFAVERVAHWSLYNNKHTAILQAIFYKYIFFKNSAYSDSVFTEDFLAKTQIDNKLALVQVLIGANPLPESVIA